MVATRGRAVCSVILSRLEDCFLSSVNPSHDHPAPPQQPPPSSPSQISTRRWKEATVHIADAAVFVFSAFNLRPIPNQPGSMASG